MQYIEISNKTVQEVVDSIKRSSTKPWFWSSTYTQYKRDFKLKG